MMRRFLAMFAVLAIVLLVSLPATPVSAQSGQGQDLVMFTSYPSQVVELGQSMTFKLTLRSDTTAQTVQLDMKEIPEGWTGTFRGGGHIVKSVYVEPEKEAEVDLKLEPPADVSAGEYKFVVLAKGATRRVELPLEVTMEEKLPPRLSLTTDLPTLKGSPTTTFRYNVTLKNEGDEDLDVSLTADASPAFLITFKLTGKEVTSIPVSANETKRLAVEAKPLGEVAAGSYQITIHAQGGETEASLPLTAAVSGREELKVTAPNGRLSGEAYAGKDSPLKIIVRNDGTASAYKVELSASEPSGWKVDFSPQTIDEIPAGQQMEVTANVHPGEKAIAGDYMVTVRAKPAEGVSKSADFRITVRTSTLWGVIGIALIAVAVAVVGAAVFRFGRR